jgi:hypothetical protein
VSGTATVVRESGGPTDGSRTKRSSVSTDPPRPRTPEEESRHRFTVAAVVGCGVALPLVLWVLWDLWWGTANPLRAVPYDNFYDLQARALFHGHIYLPNGKMGIEAFVHDGRQYTYFGVFPSLIRMPILLLTSRLDGQLTAPSILVAWLCTGLASSLMIWRLRILMRGQALVGRVEAVAIGALMATIMGGSVLLDLSATPFIYNEDFAWSVPLTLASLFILLGMLERPSRRRLVAAVVLLSATNLNRTPAGYACVIGAFLVAGWFFVGKGGAANRRWALPMAGVGLVAFALNAAVTYAKFGIPIGLPMADQVWATVNAHRRYFLAANNGKAFSFAFLPSTLWAYLQPFGIHFTSLFPFITTPTVPAAARAGAVLDQTYPTASIPATMPLLFLLSLWGVVTTFRRRALGQINLARIVVLTGAAGAAGVLLWGYISERYMADFMPFLIVAAAIGLLDICRRLAQRPRKVKQTVLGLLLIGTTYGIVANLAIAAFPASQWSMTQTARFVTAERDLSPNLGASVRTGSVLPYWAPDGQLFAVNHCSGLYLSTGNYLKDVPGQQLQHFTWIPVSQSPAFSTTIGFTFNRSERYLTHSVPLVKYGKATLVLQPDGPNQVRLVLENSGTSIDWPPTTGWVFPIDYVHAEYEFTTTVDPNLNSFVVTWYGSKMLGHYVAGHGPTKVLVTPPLAGNGPKPVVTVASVRRTPVSSPFQLCRSLVGNR